MSEQQDTSCFFPTYLARQPIFDSRNRVWGYELLFRGGPDSHKADFADISLATMDVAAGSTIAPEDIFGNDKKILINFGEQSILEDVPYALPPAQTVIQIPETALQSEETVAALRDLVRDGYSIAIDDFEGLDAPQDALSATSFAIIDLLGKTPESIAHVISLAQKAGVQLLAKKVEDMDAYAMARHLGFQLFQGFFFKRPELVSGRKLTSHESSRFSLLRIIEKKDPDFDALAKEIQTDVSISYRLLTYLNSAAFSFTQPIKSIKQAIVLLGWKQLKSWLRVVILTDIQPQQKNSELFFIAVQRGKFLELIAQNNERGDIDPDSMFLLGLLSLLEPMLEVPMTEIVDKLPLDTAIKEALLERDCPQGRWLALVHAHEKGLWEDLDTITDSLGLNRLVVAVSYYKSVLWANTFFKHGHDHADTDTED